MWMKMATCICKVASEEFVSRRSRSEAKDTWWWNNDVRRLLSKRKIVSDAYT
jgi:hypothetical protein